MEGCPLTLKFLDTLHNHFHDDVFWQSKMPRVHHLHERAECAGSSRIRLHQRAFLAVEIMATRGIPSSYHIGFPGIASLRWNKSAAGIALLLTTLRIERDELIAGQVEFLMDSSELNKGPEQLLNAKAKRQIQFLTELEDAAMVLRRSLRKNFISQALSVVGLRLADSTFLLGQDAQLDIAQELLDQTENVERRAWDPKIQSEM